MLIKVTIEGWMQTDEPLTIGGLQGISLQDLGKRMDGDDMLCTGAEFLYVSDDKAPGDVLEFFGVNHKEVDDDPAGAIEQSQ